MPSICHVFHFLFRWIWTAHKRLCSFYSRKCSAGWKDVKLWPHQALTWRTDGQWWHIRQSSHMFNAQLQQRHLSAILWNSLCYSHFYSRCGKKALRTYLYCCAVLPRLKQKHLMQFCFVLFCFYYRWWFKFTYQNINILMKRFKNMSTNILQNTQYTK